MVVGERRGPHHRQSALKSSLRVLLRLLVKKWTAGGRTPDINSGLRVLGKSITMRYFPHLCDTFSFTT